MVGPTALTRKLFRDLIRLWPQALAIALVMSAGVATFVMSIGSYRSLEETRAAYYDRYLFGHVFADVTRAPLALADEMRAIDGVAAVEPRVLKVALLDLEDDPAPSSAYLVSLPETGVPSANRVYIREGRRPHAGAVDEALVSEQFAAAHRLRPGDTFAALVNGRRRALLIVGTALAPEFVYPLGPGDLMPDPRRFGIIWMGEDALAAAYDLDGAFSNVVLRLRRDASVPEVIDRVDALLARYGGLGAYDRDDHVSDAFLDAELEQLKVMSRILPPVFLVVAAFLLNMTMSRLVALEREQIGLLKALGYSTLQVATHYLQFVGAVSLVGIVIGWALGTWLGARLTELYGDFYYFPFLMFYRGVDVYLAAAAVTLAAAAAGTLRAVLSVVGLPPAVAMSPPAPPRYTSLFGNGFVRRLAVPTSITMVLRQLWRFPFRTGTSILGTALAVMVLLASLWPFGSIAHFKDVTFFRAERYHATVAFADEQPHKALFEVARLPGVLEAEPFRTLPVRIRHGALERRVSTIGMPAEPNLSRILDLELQPVALPPSGLVVTQMLARTLKLEAGDTVELDLLSRGGETVTVPVLAVIQGYLGLGSYMQRAAANRLMREGDVIDGVHVTLDPAEADAFFAALKRTPVVSAVVQKARTLEKFDETVSANINTQTVVFIVLAVVIAFGVAYNYARITLSERSRELASLRVLGFSQNEVARIVFLELALITLLAQPIGWLLGYGLAATVVASFESELYSMPLIMGPHVFAIASAVVLTASAGSAAIVRRRIATLDLIAVLKTRD